ncbi:NAD-dependent epimerase [Fidelibacter multiformis]|uniref:NAD-dependent epimerase n=1 Tax=Fidelibacter multiformis TaxID=3377529 RepID=UPI0037DD4C0C
MTKILVTGTAGFIGFHLAKRLLERGDTIVGIDNINDYYDVNLKYARLAETGISREAEKWYTKVDSTKYYNYSFVRMNLEDREQLNQLFEQEKFDKVCHLAAQAGVRYSLENPHAYINSNIVGFINILEACRHHNIKHLAYASSSSVYGNNTKMPLSTADNVDHPISLYAATKKSNELMAHTYSHLFGLPTTGLRFFTVYGPWGRPDMALFLFTKAILEDKPIKVFNNGNMVRDFTFVDDIVEGVTRVIDNPPALKNVQGTNFSSSQEEYTADKRREVVISPDIENPINQTPAPPARETHEVNVSTAPYKVYNIGNSSPVQLMEYISAIEKTLGREAQKEYLPMQPGDVPRTEADVTDLVENLGYKPDTLVQKGIERFIDWFKSYFSAQ